MRSEARRLLETKYHGEFRICLSYFSTAMAKHHNKKAFHFSLPIPEGSKVHDHHNVESMVPHNQVSPLSRNWEIAFDPRSWGRERSNWNGRASEIKEPTTNDTLPPPTRSRLLIIPKQFHQLGPSIETYESMWCIFSQNITDSNQLFIDSVLKINSVIARVYFSHL